MRLQVEEIPTKTSILFVFKKNYAIINSLKKTLANYGFSFFSSVSLPRRLDHFHSIIVVNDPETTKRCAARLNSVTKINFIALFIHNKQNAERLGRLFAKSRLSQIKIVNVDEQHDEETVSKILWFTFSQSNEIFFNLEKTLKKKPDPPAKKPLRLKLSFKTATKIFLVVFFVSEFFFIMPLGLTGFLLYKSARSLENTDRKVAKQYLIYAQPFLTATKLTYQAARPLLSLFYLALITDDFINIEDSAFFVLTQSFNLDDNGKRLLALVLNNGKTGAQDKETIVRLTLLKNQLADLSDKLTLLSQKLGYKLKPLPELKTRLEAMTRRVALAQKLVHHADIILGKNAEKKYLLLFQNNMELRPGGGFIGSFGIATFAHYTLKDLTIKDVYEADGQLKTHIAPPRPIAQYLKQPHWFLRDSNFSPDFQDNFEKAAFFLEKELGLKDFDGAVGLTTTAISTLLEATGEIYLPDYQEYVNRDNFYIKAQTQAETDFFPGSIQKKTFLASLTRALLFNLENADFSKLGQALKTSLDEKQLVVYFQDETINDDPDFLSWTGQVILPQCDRQDDEQNKIPRHKNTVCLRDSLFPIDANLGVNKANFFVSRLLNLKVKINKDGIINHFFSIKFKNDSPGEVFPGGTYKNYFQVYLPKDILIKEVTKNGSLLVDDYELIEKTDSTVIAFYFEVPPQKTTDVKIVYRLKTAIAKGKNLYQLIVQKQIGALNNDFVLEIGLPSNISLVNHNFPALAKNNRLVYNTSLSTDQIFVVELIKKDNDQKTKY